MANKRKKKRNNKKKIEAVAPNKKLPFKKLGILVGLFALSTALYYALALNGYEIVCPAYIVLSGILFVVYFIMNKGLMAVPSRDRLVDSMTEEEKDDFLAEVIANKKRSEPVLYVFIAVLLTVLFDYVYILLSSGPIGDMLARLGGGA